MIRPAPTTDAAVTLRACDKRFGSTHAVRGLDLTIPRGALCGFLGPNGAGKSTTIRMILSIIYPDSGEVRVLGSSALAQKDRIGYLPEERGSYRTMKVLEFLAYMGRLKGLSRADAPRRAAQWLERIELPGVEKKKCQELSKGMQQKVQFVAAVLHEPELLILDEPFSGLDPVNARLLLRIVSELRTGGRTIIFSTHQMHHAEQLCDRVVLINRGEVLLDATVAEVRASFDPRTIRLEALAADPGGAGSLVARLTSLPGAVAADPDGKGGWLVRIGEGCDPQVTMAAAMALAPLRSIELQRTTLDEVFVRLVEASGGAAPHLLEELRKEDDRG